jgi:hypothetical protein
MNTSTENKKEMKRNNNTEPKNGMLTNPMDIGTEEFKNFQAITGYSIKRNT